MVIEKLSNLEKKFSKLDSDYQSNLKYVSLSKDNSDSRIGWAISIMSVVFSLIIFGGGFLIYLTAIQPAREILKDFNKKVEKKFVEKERQDIFNRINLAFENLRLNNYQVNSNIQLTIENLPYPLEEVYKEEILRNIIIANIDSSAIIAVFRVLEKYFFKKNDYINNQFAKYLLNNNTYLKNDIIRYFSQHHEDSTKLIEILFPAIIKWKESIWVFHRELCLSKFDDLFHYLEDKDLLLSSYSDYIKFRKSYIHHDSKGYRIDKSNEDYKNELKDEIAQILPQNINSYGYIKFIELFENHFDDIINEK